MQLHVQLDAVCMQLVCSSGVSLILVQLLTVAGHSPLLLYPGTLRQRLAEADVERAFTKLNACALQ